MIKQKINAVHENDLEKFFSSLGLLQDIKNKKLKCNICNNVITLENFASIYPYKNEIQFCCDRFDCYNSVLRKMERVI